MVKWDAGGWECSSDGKLGFTTGLDADAVCQYTYDDSRLEAVVANWYDPQSIECVVPISG